MNKGNNMLKIFSTRANIIIMLMNSMGQVMLDLFALPEVAECVSKSRGPVAPQLLQSVPVATRKGVYVNPWHLDMSEEAKYGAGGKWPSNVAVRAHFGSIVQRGYEAEREPLEIKFSETLHGSGKELPMFCVQYIDGHTKAIMILAVFALLEHLVTHLLY